MTIEEIIHAAASAGADITFIRHKESYMRDEQFSVRLTASADGATLEIKATSPDDPTAAFNEAWSRFRAIAAPAKLMAPQLDYQPLSQAIDDEIPF